MGVVVAWCVTFGAAFAVADGVAVGRWVGMVLAVDPAVAVALDVTLAVVLAVMLDVALAVAVDRTLDVALALDVALSVAEPLPPDKGEGVLDAPPLALPVVLTCGLGVETDGTDGEGDPPLEQAATVTVSKAATAAT